VIWSRFTDKNNYEGKKNMYAVSLSVHSSRYPTHHRLVLQVSFLKLIANWPTSNDIPCRSTSPSVSELEATLVPENPLPRALAAPLVPQRPEYIHNLEPLAGLNLIMGSCQRIRRSVGVFDRKSASASFSASSTFSLVKILQSDCPLFILALLSFRAGI